MKRTSRLWPTIVVWFLVAVVAVGTTSSAGTPAPEQKNTIVVSSHPVVTRVRPVLQTPEQSQSIITPSVHPSALFPPTVTKAVPTETAAPASTYKLCQEGSEEICFGDVYNLLPGNTYVHVVIVPDTIVIHTDDQSGNTPERWFSATTWNGLKGQGFSVHFGVGLDGVSQFLPMYKSGVTQCDGAWDSYNLHSIQIEMSGRNYNYFITGQASPKMAASVKTITDKTINLVIALMEFYNIPFKNVMGHYQMEGSGKTDPGNLYFEQYFLPLLKSRLDQQNGSQGPNLP